MRTIAFNPARTTILDGWTALMEGKMAERCFFVSWSRENIRGHAFLFRPEAYSPKQIADTIVEFVDKYNKHATITCICEITGPPSTGSAALRELGEM